jgi:hypothetical protein
MSAESARLWREAHPEYQRAWHAAHRDEQREYRRAYRAAHCDLVRAQDQSYAARHYRANAEAIRERAAAYQLAHRERANAYGQAYRARVAGSEWLRSRTAARNAVTHALERGGLLRAPCSECGADAQAHHHRGYEPESHLDVIWLCPAHHGEQHRTVAA